jgi:glycosyltransferase involved in cell wall biosynthesis
MAAADRPDDLVIGYLPFFETTVEKGYTVRMRESLAAFGRVVRYDGVVATWRMHHRRIDWLVLNWTDNDLLDRKTKRVAARKIVRLFAKTLLMRLAARRLAFVRHNVYPHAVARGGEERARRWVDRYERLFDAVLAHSGDETQRGRDYCPHPLYRRVDAVVDPPLLHALPARFFVVFGRIVRYKHLDRLMAAFPEDETLLVIGAVGDRRHADELAASARPNVRFRPGLVDEAEAQAIVSKSTALLIAHADADVIVSASFFFAMSLGVPVVAVRTPFLDWIAPRLGPSLLRTAADVDDLVRSLPSMTGTPAPTVEAIEREFGDEAVRQSLSSALRLR